MLFEVFDYRKFIIFQNFHNIKQSTNSTYKKSFYKQFDDNRKLIFLSQNFQKATGFLT